MTVTPLTYGVSELSAPPALRVAVVGAGFMGRVHAEAARRAGARVVAAMAGRPENADAAALAVGAERGYADLDDLLAHASVDVVHICTPNALHAEAARAALAAGAHVVCEKPLATEVPQAAALNDAATAAGRVATVPFVYRFHPMVRELRERLAAAEAGIVSAVNGSYLQDWLSRRSDDDWRVDSAMGGPSRSFADIGSHWCDLFEFVSGDRIARLSAQTSVVHERAAQGSGPATEDVASVQFRTAAGRVGTLVVSQVAAGRKNRLQMEISGTEASFAFDQEDPERLWVGRRDGSHILVRDPGAMSAAAARYARLPAGHAQGYQDCFDAFVADTYRAVRGDDAPDGLPTFADGLRAVRITDAVLTSAAGSGAWTEIAA
ncbi:Gfo/Idh/MocA family oxidoreductase [Streptomyces sp. NBC_00873]|uniref:Gfo/Idh/MocA family protein n=1 Tax=unclassified Streptomyces TaxID=2593676 RepID=UPI003865649E|nr:Gfo/Idh/MocA family oxidoreductase [Streptomyces sp. NBC_00873]WTA43985.1 Gfo/Idh/MocA family oxidoreductase [Streptomyces sp. NBC_00842]